jgi:hypothetical protein
MRKLLTLILILCTVTLFAEMRGGSQYDPGAARSNLTNITSGSALGVANGGTGKTTAAEALTALGGASLNGSSTVDFLTKDLNVSGVATFTDFVKLGESAPAIKIKPITGQLSASPGASTTAAHGLTGAQIITCIGRSYFETNNGVPFFSSEAGFELNVKWDPTNIILTTTATNSASILGTFFYVIVVYVE